MRRPRRVLLAVAAFAAAAALGIALNLALLGAARSSDDPVGKLTPVSAVLPPATPATPSTTPTTPLQTTTTPLAEDDDRGGHGRDEGRDDD